MSLALEYDNLVIYIDNSVKQILSNDGDYIDILIALSYIMEDLKKLMDSTSKDEKDQYCERYDGFYLFMTLLEDIASGISSEMISVPTYH